MKELYLKTKDKLSKETLISSFILILLVCQPILDILSYFAILGNVSSITTVLRLLVFGFIVMWAFLISDNKKTYFIMVGVLGLYWILHVAVNMRDGYISIVEDTAMYLRTIQGPVLTIAFITFLKKAKDAAGQIGRAFWINFITITISIILSFAVGMPEYTYYYTDIGIKGWFYTGNAQSCILAMMPLMALYYTYTKKNFKLFVFSVALVFLNLYMFGTKVTYYAILICSVGFIVLLLWNHSKDKKIYLVFVAAIAISLLTYKLSPCYENQYKTYIAFENKNDHVHDIIEESTEEGTEDSTEDEGEKPLLTEAHINTYTEMCAEMVERFGVEKVAEIYNYSLDANVFNNQRNEKLAYSTLVIEEKDFLGKLFGFEYMEYIGPQGTIFDPENDFPAVYYSYGYVGFGLYVAFIAFFAIFAIKVILKNIKKIDFEMGALGISLVLTIGAAQLSGNVLRRPNVSIYFAIMIAYLYILSIRESKKEV